MFCLFIGNQFHKYFLFLKVEKCAGQLEIRMAGYVGYVPAWCTCATQTYTSVRKSDYTGFMAFSKNTFCLTNESPNNTFSDRHRMGYWIYHRVRAEQGPKTKFVLGTPSPNGMGFTLQLRQFSLSSRASSRLQVFRCELFKLLSVIELTLSKHYGPIVRLKDHLRTLL